MKYSLRSLMIAVLVLPPLIAVGYAMTVRFMAEPERLPEGGSYFDDVQYFVPGPEFKLSREAAARIFAGHVLQSHAIEEMDRCAQTQPE